MGLDDLDYAYCRCVEFSMWKPWPLFHRWIFPKSSKWWPSAWPAIGVFTSIVASWWVSLSTSGRCWPLRCGKNHGQVGWWFNMVQGFFPSAHLPLFLQMPDQPWFRDRKGWWFQISCTMAFFHVLPPEKTGGNTDEHRWSRWDWPQQRSAVHGGISCWAGLLHHC